MLYEYSYLGPVFYMNIHIAHDTKVLVTLRETKKAMKYPFPVPSSLVPTPLSENSRRGLATVPYNGLSRAVCTVRANQIAQFSYVTLIASWPIYAQVGVVPFDKAVITSDVAERKIKSCYWSKRR